MKKAFNCVSFLFIQDDRSSKAATSSTPASSSAAPDSSSSGGKRQLKPYGKRQDSTGSTSRSRSATKELECKSS